VHTPSKPFVQGRKFDNRSRPGRLLGFDQPFGSGIYKVPLDSREVTQLQTVIFDDAPHVPPPVLAPPPVLLPEVATKQQLRWEGDMDGDSEDEVQVHTSVLPVPLVPPVAPFAGASDDGSVSADEVELLPGRASSATSSHSCVISRAASRANRQWGAGSRAACASFAESTSEVRECSYKRTRARHWGHSRRASVPLDGPKAKAGLSAHGTKPAG
jgi:hypothetical protein